MDRRERMQDFLTAISAALDGRQGIIWTALPGILQSFDPAKMTCSVQPSIQEPVARRDGTANFVNLPVLINCPVIFPAGGGFALTFPLIKNDEGLVIFSSRCIDAWWQSGGIQKQAELRMHDLSDGFFLPGVFSQPRVPASVSGNGVQLRNADGSIAVQLSASGIKFKGNVEIEGDLSFSGGGQVQGNVAINGDVTAHTMTGTTEVVAKAGGLAIHLSTHRHPANNTPPTPGT